MTQVTPLVIYHKQQQMFIIDPNIGATSRNAINLQGNIWRPAGTKLQAITSLYAISINGTQEIAKDTEQGTFELLQEDECLFYLTLPPEPNNKTKYAMLGNNVASHGIVQYNLNGLLILLVEEHDVKLKIRFPLLKRDEIIPVNSQAVFATTDNRIYITNDNPSLQIYKSITSVVFTLTVLYLAGTNATIPYIIATVLGAMYVTLSVVTSTQTFPDKFPLQIAEMICLGLFLILIVIHKFIENAKS